MANTAQARKRARQAVKQNEHNSSLRSKLRTSIKAVRKAIETGDKASAAKVFAATQATTIELCKLAKIAPEPLSAGMPRSSFLIPSTGRIRNLFLYVDFPDNPSNSSSKKFADNYFTKSKK